MTTDLRPRVAPSNPSKVSKAEQIVWPTIDLLNHAAIGAYPKCYDIAGNLVWRIGLRRGVEKGVN
jgi:hypothetical protein